MSGKVDSSLTMVEEKIVDVRMSLRRSDPTVSGVQMNVSTRSDDITFMSKSRQSACKLKIC